MSLRIFYSILLVCVCMHTHAQTQYVRKYIVFFKDKDSTFSIHQPNQFLTERSLLRKKKLGVQVDWDDLPVSTTYLNQLQHQGFAIKAVSRWMNAALVHVTNKLQPDVKRQFPFISEVFDLGGMTISSLTAPQQPTLELIKEQLLSQSVKANKRSSVQPYGKMFEQLQFGQIPYLHQQGLTGNDVWIAVVDDGFLGVDQEVTFKHPLQQVVNTRDLVDGDAYVFNDDDHGTSVWSTMAANDSFFAIGAAPSATYILIRSEYAHLELPEEEFLWGVAAELADSLGVDILTSSLGYTQFDEERFDHKTNALKSSTSWVSKFARTASRKGILVVVSAGNEGNKKWRLLSLPAEVESVLTVGAVNYDHHRTSFSSIGFKQGELIKPNVVTIGHDVAVLNEQGELVSGSGTSFSAPLLAGGLACIWPLIKDKSPSSVINLLQHASSNTTHPNVLVGYGVVDFSLVYHQLMGYTQDTLLRLSCKNETCYMVLNTLKQQELELVITTQKGKEVRFVSVLAGVHKIPLDKISSQGDVRVFIPSFHQQLIWTKSNEK